MLCILVFLSWVIILVKVVHKRFCGRVIVSGLKKHVNMCWLVSTCCAKGSATDFVCWFDVSLFLGYYIASGVVVLRRQVMGSDSEGNVKVQHCGFVELVVCRVCVCVRVAFIANMLECYKCLFVFRVSDRTLF